SQVYTPQRAQNIVSEENAEELFGLFEAYEDVIERCRVVTLPDIEEQGYTLQVGNYIERKREEAEPPEKVRARFLDLLDEADAAEERFHELLAKGGYLDER
ncbi:MAG: N-6 DNA methylase, partial [Coriobacteriaceae bacterium]|nr:N-6 DNA methylase [Coriobacteriaceae bacterium]